MTIATDGQICYVIWFGEDVEFPWGTDEDIESWWRDVNGFESIYTADGEYKSGIAPTKAEREAYWKRADEFDAAHPLLVTLVNAQSMSYPAYILALKSTVITARRGHPVEIKNMHVVPFNEVMYLQQFCAKYDIDMPSEPAWYLSSFWEE